jgi:hypothetical protein
MVGWCKRRLGLALGFGFVLALVAAPSRTEATVQVGNAEIQLVYEMQHTFQADGDPTSNFEWVQWRNELRLEYFYDSLIEDGRLLGKLYIPFVKSADFAAILRPRIDPVYLVREKYQDLYSDKQQKGFFFPKGETFREFYLDLRFGKVGPGQLSARIGRQQVVWGESDLFRSLDIINPLRIDQNGFVGEAFEDFRTPLLIAKFLYDLGTVGPFSDLGLELVYTPRWRPAQNQLILEGAFTLEYANTGDDDNNFKQRPDGRWENRLAPYKKRGLVRNPWTIFRVGPNAHTEAADFACQSPDCSVRSSFIYLIDRKRHNIKGTKWDNSMIGFRILGKTFGNVDFTVNYLFKRSDAASGIEWKTLFDVNQPGTGAVLPETLYGFGIPGQDLEAGIRRCIVERKPTIVAQELYGYNTNDNPNDDRLDLTGCLQTYHWYPWTNVVGFTLTYNDYKYTGAVFRTEQSWSSKEPRNKDFSGAGGGSVPAGRGALPERGHAEERFEEDDLGVAEHDRLRPAQGFRVDADHAPRPVVPHGAVAHDLSGRKHFQQLRPQHQRPPGPHAALGEPLHFRGHGLFP